MTRSGKTWTFNTDIPYRRPVNLFSSGDDAKATSDLTKHGIDFAYAANVVLDPNRVDVDASHAQDREMRRKAIGMVEARLLIVVYAVRAISSWSTRSGPSQFVSSPLAAPTHEKAKYMARFTLDPDDPPRASPESLARLDAMTEADITAAALSEPENPPLTNDELSRLGAAQRLRAVRQHTGLSQARFAAQYRISVGRLGDLEQGRTTADSALLAYLNGHRTATRGSKAGADGEGGQCIARKWSGHPLRCFSRAEITHIQVAQRKMWPAPLK